MVVSLGIRWGTWHTVTYHEVQPVTRAKRNSFYRKREEGNGEPHFSSSSHDARVTFSTDSTLERADYTRDPLNSRLPEMMTRNVLWETVLVTISMVTTLLCKKHHTKFIARSMNRPTSHRRLLIYTFYTPDAKNQKVVYNGGIKSLWMLHFQRPKVTFISV